MADIFISYKKADRERAASLARMFQDVGYTVWWDTHLRTGEEWFRRILKEVREAKCLVGVWTHRSIDTDGLFAPSADDGHNYISIEHDVAGRNKIIGAVFQARAVPLVYRDLQAALLTDWDVQDASHAGLASLIERVNELAGRAALVSNLAPALQSEPRMDVVADLRATWASFSARGSVAAIEKFLARVQSVAPGSGLEFEVEHHLDELQHAAEAKEHAHQEQEAAERAKVEAEARAQREWEELLGPEAARAALAAKAGEHVAERLYPVQLNGVPNWPEPTMVAIPPGQLLMGAAEGEVGSSDLERPQHEVRIDYLFALGQHTVTFAEWDAALAAGARLEKPGDQGWGRDRRPVIKVSWEDAQAYLGWVNERLGLVGRLDAYRLPSEAEWEHACRAGTKTPFNLGDRVNQSQAQFSKGNFGSAGQTAPVGSYAANGFGLYDMHGNVWEWCADKWHETYTAAPVDGSVWDVGDASRRVLRGGSWYGNSRFLRSAFRSWDIPSLRSNVYGFRLARTLSPPFPPEADVR